MRSIFSSLLVTVLCAAALAQSGANYQITINGQTSDVALGEEYTFTTPSGEVLKYVVELK